MIGGALIGDDEVRLEQACDNLPSNRQIPKGHACGSLATVLGVASVTEPLRRASASVAGG